MPSQSTAGRKALRALGAAARFIEEDLPAALLAICVVLLCTDVVGRYVFNHPFVGAGSLAMVCFVWVTYIGSAAIARRGRHIVIDVLTDRFSPRLQAIVQILVQMLVLGMICYVIGYAWNALLNTRFVEIPGIGISRRVITLALFIGFLLMLVYAARDLVLAFRGALTGSYSVRTDDDEFESLNTASPTRAGYEPPAEVTEAVFIKEALDEDDRPKGDRR